MEVLKEEEMGKQTMRRRHSCNNQRTIKVKQQQKNRRKQLGVCVRERRGWGSNYSPIQGRYLHKL